MALTTPGGHARDGGSDDGRVPAGSVIVCTRDRPQFLRRCLGSLERQLPTPRGFEVVVVDNGSGEDSRPFLSQWTAAAPSGDGS